MYLIDGNNLIGHTKEIPYHDPGARQRLLDHIVPFLEASHSKATVVFDGGSQSLRKSRRIQLVFSGSMSSADDRIRHLVESAPAPRDLCVVSSDNAVYGYSRSCGSRAIKCHEFNRLIRETAQSHPPGENREHTVEDLKQWLRYFGEEEE